MDKQVDKTSEGKINAGRGVVKRREKHTISDEKIDKNLDDDRPDDRARKAGY